MALLENIKQPPGEVFAAADDEISFQPATADAKNRTVDVVWIRGRHRCRGWTR